MRLEKTSRCKINLILNILGRRSDGFHDLETVMQPVGLCDELTFETAAQGIQLSCDCPKLPTDSRNLVWRAAEAFLKASGTGGGVRIALKKNLPLSAGLGGGSGNAAATLLGLNDLFGNPLSPARLHELAASLGSDIPFFLQPQPALALGRGEIIRPLDRFPALKGVWLLLVHPGFGVSTPWAYQQLAQFPGCLHGQPGRAEVLISKLQHAGFEAAAAEFYNAFEPPVFRKYPLLALFQEFFRSRGVVTLMSGSGSSTFAMTRDRGAAGALLEAFRSRFGDGFWTALAPLDDPA